MSLDIESIQALIWSASVSTEEGRLVLDETGACSDDLLNGDLSGVWAIIEGRVRARAKIEPVTVREALAGKFSGSLDFLFHPRPCDARQILTAFHDAATRRRLIERLRKVATEVRDGAPFGEVDSLLRALPATLGKGSRVRNCEGDASAILDELISSSEGKKPRRIETGMAGLDACVGGLPSNLIVLGARPGVGKSAFVAGCVRNWVTNGESVGVLCYEDDAKDMERRIIAHRAGVQIKHVRGDFPCNNWQQQKIAESIEWWHPLSKLLWVDDDRPTGSIADALASIRQMAARGCRAIVLDNLTCLRLDGLDDRRHDLAVADALAAIRAEAQDNQIPILVVGHLKRGSDGFEESSKPPKLSDFSNAIAWENYSRLALGMWRADGAVKMRILKQTNGPAGQDFDLHFAAESAVITGASAAVEAKPVEIGRPRVYQRNSPPRGDV